MVGGIDQGDWRVPRWTEVREGLGWGKGSYQHKPVDWVIHVVDPRTVSVDEEERQGCTRAWGHCTLGYRGW